MDKIRTVFQAQDLLDREYGWRIKELADIKSAIQSAEEGRERTLIRAGIPLLYAHWEGFVKMASETYLNYVTNQRHQYKELKSCFIVWGLKKEINELTESNNAERNHEIVNFIMDRLDERTRFTHQGAVDTASNLSSKVFANIAASIGISTTPYETKYHFIDESVLRRRNRIAHGEYLDVGPDEYGDISNEIIVLLRSFKTDVENALSLNSHKRHA